MSPLEFNTRYFLTDRNVLKNLDQFLQSADTVDALLARMSLDPQGSDIHDDSALYLCAGLWDSVPDKRHMLAAIALKRFANVLDADVETADKLRAHIPDFDSRPDLKAAFQKIRATARAKQRYYFHSRFQARNIDKLKAQLFPAPPATISRKAHFTCIGSCFATNLGTALIQRGVPNVMGIRYQDNSDPLSVLDAVMRDSTFKADISAGGEQIVILTAGFAEENGGFLKPDDVTRTIVGMQAKLKEWNPNSRLIVTVSPVPLSGTATGLSPYEANAISKAIIRLGVEGARQQGVEYFPSYELVTQHFPAIGVCPVGTFDGMPQHVNRDVVLFITDMFIAQYIPWVDLSADALPAIEMSIRHIGP